MIANEENDLESDVKKHLESIRELEYWSTAAQIGVAVGFDRQIAARKVRSVLNKLFKLRMLECDRDCYPLIYRLKIDSKGGQS